MRIVEVTPAKLPRLYRTPGEAVREEVGTARCVQAQKDSELIAGAFIERLCIRDDGMWLKLSNHRCLSVTVGADGAPIWAVGDEEMYQWESDPEPGPMELIWPRSGRRTKWEPMSLFRNRLQLPLSVLWAGEEFVNVYFQRGGEFRCEQLVNLTDRCQLLFFWELTPVRLASKSREA